MRDERDPRALIGRQLAVPGVGGLHPDRCLGGEVARSRGKPIDEAGVERRSHALSEYPAIRRSRRQGCRRGT